ncbi:aspartate--tRNA ligase, mitochondrial-like isoform X2 [Mizuhopecten yessoensis]|uniref:Aspartate--tRNA ligase, mitochondrial n=1 Tax=Mizuhopecten yessoensis TaxID=6573 RepID=A0A210Q1C6_MIZYE|nr:aspartate--tRNA ligase, mitochondrial-like isoform X2 [Mizuhopecten yessoensis]OWF42536.1 Aspartate--tRNA ligase, mitochondrial [Mizuhopecten yessoensis]
MSFLHSYRHLFSVLTRRTRNFSHISTRCKAWIETKPSHEKIVLKQFIKCIEETKSNRKTFSTSCTTCSTENAGDGQKTSENQPISFTDRSHLCGCLTTADVGQSVKLCGWVDRVSKLFLKLYDWTGRVQITVPPDMVKMVMSLDRESVVEVKGIVMMRPDSQKRAAVGSGEVEILPSEIKVLNTCNSLMPFHPTCISYQKVTSDVRMEHRYLDIRSVQMQRILRLRSSFIMKAREFLCNNHGFVDVETPTLFRKTPGGAKEFLVPTRRQGRFYSLPQSPQQFKQLLMIGGVDRYFQIARCYRDEAQRPNRQPEFTQLDIEMAFTSQTHIMSLIERLLHHCWPRGAGTLPDTFPVMKYEQALREYGTDKPDTRFDMKLQDISDVMSDCGVVRLASAETVIALRIPEGQKYFSNKELDTLCKPVSDDDKTEIITAKISSADDWKSSISKHLKSSCRDIINKKLQLEPGDILLLCHGAGHFPFEVLGKKRLMTANHLEQKGQAIRNSSDNNIFWVVDFPLFLPKEDESGKLIPGLVESAHHPFTAPIEDDLDLVYSDPNKVRSQHYDLVLNGNEIGGGSVRIHNAKLQKYVLSEILKEDTSELSHLLSALDMGCPPHAGIALGLDRLFAILSGVNNIKDVIAFPKSFMGSCPMSKAPSKLSESDLSLYHLTLKS